MGRNVGSLSGCIASSDMSMILVILIGAMVLGFLKDRFDTKTSVILIIIIAGAMAQRYAGF